MEDQPRDRLIKADRPRPRSWRAPVSVLEIRDLRAEIRLRDATVRAVDGVSLAVAEGETLGLVGESGCGKTMLGTSVIRLLPPGGGHLRRAGAAGRPRSGAAVEREMRKVRGGDIGMVFQDPMTSLDPTMPIGRQIAESVQQHKDVSRKAGLERAAEVLGLVGMPRPAERLDDYPHQLSGGLRQRVMIALALANEPSCSSPTSRRPRWTSRSRRRFLISSTA